MLAERRLILRGVVAMGARFVRVKTASLAVSQLQSPCQHKDSRRKCNVVIDIVN